MSTANLSSIRNRLYSLSDYKPANPAYTQELDLIISDAYAQIWNAAAWTFSVKADEIPVHADIDAEWLGTETRGTVALKVYSGSTRVILTQTGTGVDPSFTLITNSGYGWDRPGRPSAPWVGQVLELMGVEYTIMGIGDVAGEAALYLDKAVRQVNPTPSVVEPASGWQAALYEFNTTDFKIKPRYVYLPTEIQELYTVAFKDNGGGANVFTTPLKAYNWYEGTQPVGNLDLTGTPWAYVREPDLIIPAGEKISVAFTEDEDASLQGGSYIELAWAYMGPGGVVGPLSDSVISAPTGTSSTTYSITVTASGWDGQNNTPRTRTDADTALARPVAEYNAGFRRVCFYNATLNASTGKRVGEPKWLPVTQAAIWDAATWATLPIWRQSLGHHWYQFDDELEIIDWLQVSTQAGWPAWSFNNRVRRIRLYPRSSLVNQVRPEIRGADSAAAEDYAQAPRETIASVIATYKYMPPLMTYVTDAPEIPVEFEYLIVYKALMDLYLKNSNIALSQLYERRYNDELKSLRRRYAVAADPIRQKGPQGHYGFPFNMGLITKI
jgi:hypothetical protein